MLGEEAGHKGHVMQFHLLEVREQATRIYDDGNWVASWGVVARGGRGRPLRSCHCQYFHLGGGSFGESICDVH